MARKLTLVAPLAMFLLAGCSYIESDSPQRKQVSSSESQFTPMRYETTADAAESCRLAANATLKRDSDIDQDIASARESRGLAANLDPQLTSNLEEFGTSEQYDEMVAQCVRRAARQPTVADGYEAEQ